MRLLYRVNSCDELGGSIACAWNSQMASSLSQICVACSTMKMSSFPLWSFSCFSSSFTGIEVSNEEEYSILRILYCYSLQQHIFLAFCNDFDTHYRMLAYILLRNKTLLLYSWRFSRYSASFHWLVHGHMTSNNETVSRQMPRAGNIVKAMTSNGKQFTVTQSTVHC